MQIIFFFSPFLWSIIEEWFDRMVLVWSLSQAAVACWLELQLYEGWLRLADTSIRKLTYMAVRLLTTTWFLSIGLLNVLKIGWLVYARVTQASKAEFHWFLWPYLRTFFITSVMFYGSDRAALICCGMVPCSGLGNQR